MSIIENRVLTAHSNILTIWDRFEERKTGRQMLLLERRRVDADRFPFQQSPAFGRY
jgi:hypothetical protein